MVRTVRVDIVGAPVACADGIRDTWRELSSWVAAQLELRYGDAVQVAYHDLFDPDVPTLPADASLPSVLVNGEILSSGGKLSIPLIRRAIDALGSAPDASATVASS